MKTSASVQNLKSLLEAKNQMWNFFIPLGTLIELEESKVLVENSGKVAARE
jgi:hypothetical protein